MTTGAVALAVVKAFWVALFHMKSPLGVIKAVRHSNFTKISNALVANPRELLKVLPRGGCGPVQNCLVLGWVCPDVPFLHSGAYEGDSIGVEFTFLAFNQVLIVGDNQTKLVTR